MNKKSERNSLLLSLEVRQVKMDFKKIKDIILDNKRWILLSILLIIFVMIAEDVFENELFQSDFVIYDFLVAHRTPFLTSLFKVITLFGGAVVLISITILCVIFVKKKKYKYVIPINLCLIAFLNIILKNFFERPRPDNFRIIEETGFSFPSGHSMVSMAFYGHLIYLIFTNVKNKKCRNVLCVVLGILVFLIGLSRVYLGVHYTSDVIAGFCFSMSYLIFMISVGLYK